jgi:PTH1 family peptidyl-tRNA hydrolase
LRASGSSGGHNGLENIESLLNSNKYPRLRIGISNPNENFNQVDFVLGKFNDEEYDLLSSEFSNIDKLVTSFVISGIDQTMNNFNN